MGKLTLAALEPVLRLYLTPERLPERLTTLRLFTRPQADMQAQAAQLQAALQAAVGPGYAVRSAPCFSQIGSGALPVNTLPSWGLAFQPVQPKGGGGMLGRLEAALRALPRPVIGRIEAGALWLDLRCLEAHELPTFQAQLPLLGEALAQI